MSEPNAAKDPANGVDGAPCGWRVALVLASSTGGVGSHVRSLLEGLVADGFEVFVFGPQATDHLFGFSSVGARFTPVEIPASPGPADVSAVRVLRGSLRGADVVHAHGLRAGLLSGWALGRRNQGGPPLVLTLHNAVLTRGLRGRLLRSLEGRAIRRADIVLGASSDLVRGAEANGAAHAMLGAVASPVSQPAGRARDEVRAELGIIDQPLLLAVGRLHPQKGYDVLWDAAARWRTAPDRRIIVVAGDGPLEGELAKRIAVDGLPIRLLGRRSDVADLMAAADIMVLTSRWEARALVAQEALNAGLPLVATSVGGIPELVAGAASLVPAGDVDALVQAVDDLLAHPSRRQELIAAGHRQAATWPDERATVTAVEQTYRQALALGQPGERGGGR